MVITIFFYHFFDSIWHTRHKSMEKSWIKQFLFPKNSGLKILAFRTHHMCSIGFRSGLCEGQYPETTPHHHRAFSVTLYCSVKIWPETNSQTANVPTYPQIMTVNT
ncbi:hypothetical protein PHYBLDRAFT_58828 [Phycomyces blakesleeanus NRRL 1555(-)]|uniref:Uncharacterized protein n=1 Tax=Phycomyces blakesleeanus (strain ATCC 8743b / DSM 1359 / FGSC 10004 / NBRC 33097 / NRRL 1555) TaxID=763407 RepID=A0A167QJ98_PHYB8|nr:hypothetical protein PHYBLDRAFT_58828 [Phycomyces blakesleeanus NRRL 1555(-)]OAD79781.1 hypothetical protein PHYBLDRAFT_58828 [Phycomyces blakesleeanus NRRL 1555(-)]|eukprot:XP_018297821.1 hypothetical protein PHYBLDRAFT_58828 [Phycomyces blakesleeanus NRRL 1555(-)]